MLKRLFRTLQSLRAFYMVVRDPERTDLIFVVISDPHIANEKSIEMVESRLRESSKAAAMLDSRYAGQWTLEDLLKLPKESLGYVYAKHMSDNNLDINFYPPVPGESILAYVQSRSRQTHDIWHIVTGFNTSVAGEVALQAFTQAQIHARSPTLIMSMFLLHCCIFKPTEIFLTMRALAHGWVMGEKASSLFGERFEENWSKNLAQYRKELGLDSFDKVHAPYVLPHAIESNQKPTLQIFERENAISLY